MDVDDKELEASEAVIPIVVSAKNPKTCTNNTLLL
jgi:hypothetical protein